MEGGRPEIKDVKVWVVGAQTSCSTLKDTNMSAGYQKKKIVNGENENFRNVERRKAVCSFA